MIKKCCSCNMEMIEGYKAKLDNSPLANFVISGKGKTAKINAYICPNCGKVDFYVHRANPVDRKEG